MTKLESLLQDIKQTQLQLDMPFEQAQELDETMTRLVELNAEFDAENRATPDSMAGTEQTEQKTEEPAPPPAYEPEMF